MPKTRAMQFWQPTIKPSGNPIYLAIADAIGSAIHSGELPAGQRLPPQRSLAAHLGVDLTTVTRAYGEAEQRGLIEGSVGRRTFVRRASPAPRRDAPRRDAPAASLVDMSMNMPPQPPLLRELLTAGLAELLPNTDLAHLMSYRSGPGSHQDRATAAVWLRPVLDAVDPDRVLICGGAQLALAALLTTLARPNDTILTEMLTYPGFRALADQLGLRLAGVATDEHGLIPEALERACHELRPKALYCVPTIQNPTTVTTSPERRRAVAQIAARAGIAIIEDDAYGLLPTAPQPAIASMAPAVTFYLSTLSKCLTPGLRTAFVVAPDRPRAERWAAAIHAMSLAPAPLLTSLAIAWIRSDAAATLSRAVREEATARQRIAQALLPPDRLAAHPNGLHVWLTLPEVWNRAELCVQVRRAGLTLKPSDAFLVSGIAPNAVRLCLGVADSRATLRAALQSVADAIGADAPAQFAGVV